jgi:hypothetical protein
MGGSNVSFGDKYRNTRGVRYAKCQPFLRPSLFGELKIKGNRGASGQSATTNLCREPLVTNEMARDSGARKALFLSSAG